MILQAAGLALLAALSPTALLAGAVYPGSAGPRLVGTLDLADAILMSLVMGIVTIVILRNAGLSLHHQHPARYGLRLGPGVLMLAAGAALARRKPKRPDPGKAKQGLVPRMIATPAPGSAFMAGLLLFAPGLTTCHLTAFNGRLHANGNKILIAVLAAAGAILAGNGIYGLAVG